MDTVEIADQATIEFGTFKKEFITIADRENMALNSINALRNLCSIGNSSLEPNKTSLSLCMFSLFKLYALFYLL